MERKLPLNTNDWTLDNYGSFRNLDIPRLALESANIGVWIIDIATREFLPSPYMKELFGFLPEQEMSIDAALSKVAEKFRQKVSATIEEALARQEPLQLEFPLTGMADDQQRWISLLGGIHRPEESIGYLSGISMDITAQKLNDLRRIRFLGMVSHELKAPLTVLKGYTQLLNEWTRKQKDNFITGTLSKVEKQLKKMTHMINGFLNLFGVEAGKIQLDMQDFLLDEFINEVVNETFFIASNHAINYEPCGQIMVHADRNKIGQVMINLLSNAAKYSSEGSSILVQCEKGREMVLIKIKDNGIGISAADIKKIFEPHFRVENKETEKIPGFGIGLYLSSEIIKGHNSEISVESELGKGSTFAFSIPLAS
jgi:signal transduction histidine kinase